MEKVILIITGGKILDKVAEHVIKSSCFDIIIAVDGGLKLAEQFNLPIDYIVGDFDSVEKSLLEKYEELIECNRIQTIIQEFRPEKDNTDTHIDMNLAVELSATRIILLGATGSRFDHTLANVNLLMIPLKEGIKAEIIDEHNKIYLMDGKNMNTILLKKRNLYGRYLSLLPLSSEVRGVTLKGFKYPLENKTLTIGDSLGVSNELQEENCEIMIEKGVLIVVESND